MKLKKLIVTLLLLPVFVFAKANLYVFVFKDGNALQDTKIQMGEMVATTNQYGYAQFKDVKSDTYEISYIKDEQLFALEEVNIVDDQDSQIFLNLINDTPKVELDLPLEAYSQDFQKVKVKKLEGPKGILELKLIDSKSKALVKKAKLFFKGYQLEASSDENGIVKVDIPEGVYDISIVHPNYVMKVLTEIKVVKEKTTAQDVALTKSDIALEEYVVLAPAVEGSLAATFAKLKESDTIGNIMGAEQFSKSGDSSAASALQRVSGVTLVDDKYVYIRGLGERYSTVLLNGLNVPSPNPLKRVVPLDIFPTSILENLIVQKTYSSNLPGNFGGGAVTINTKGIPKEDNYVSGTLGFTYNSSTGKEGYVGSQNNKGLPNEIVQLTDGFKSFGNSDLFSETDKKEYAKDLATYRSFNVEKKTIEPGKSVSVSTGQSFKTSSGLKYGFAGNIYYKTSADIEEYTERDYKTSPDGSLTIGGNVGDFSNTKLSEKYGGLVSFGVDNTEGQSIKFTTLLLNQTNDSTTFGLVKETGSNTRVVKRTDLRYSEQEMQLYQLTGENTLFFGKTTDKVFDDVVINWGLEKAIANNNEPGNVQYEYHYYGDVEQNPPYDDTLFKLYTDKPVSYVQTELEDTMTDGKVSLKLPFEYSDQNNFFEIG
ncbi:MAG TPA: hypothetical protein ENK66_00520, partial [Arcobacter sp.]|nr:hypothetical protein [Arcobacter sp.]